jgi:haloalkane dehalogenase
MQPLPGGKGMRVLITNAYGPYDLKWGQSPSDLLGARLARGHAMLERAAELPTWSMYLLAENVSNETTVLEYPRWDDFVRALREGYDVVCIETKTVQVPRIARMVKTIRAVSPGTKIVLGGYGVSTIHEGVPSDPHGHREYLLANVDYFCRTEGVRFLRELLGDAPYDRPITQYSLPPATIRPYGGQRTITQLPAILVSLGCPSACDFCNTSAFFHHKKISVFSPAETYDCMKAHARRLNETELTFILFDEDIFLDPAYVRELGRLIRSDRATWGFRWISFGSMRALQAFDARELRECGVEGIWIGVESGLSDDSGNKATYVKRKTAVSPPELFASLRHAGIFTIGSMILGFDFHTPENIARDIQYFVSLRPTLYQIGPIRPCPGTTLYKLMRKDNRVKQNYGWEDFHLWEAGTHHFEHFTADEIRYWFDRTHEELKAQNGSPVLQIFEGHLLSHFEFRSDPSAFLRHQAGLSLATVRRMFPVIVGLLRNEPSHVVTRRMRDLLARARQALAGDHVALGAYRAVAGEVVGVGLRWLDWRHGQQAESAWAPPLRTTRYEARGLGRAYAN